MESTGYPSCTTCAPLSAPLPVAPTRRATQSLRKRTVCLLTAFRECFWDSTTKRNIWSSVQTNPWQFAIVFITLTRTLIKTLLDILVLIPLQPLKCTKKKSETTYLFFDLMWNLFYECFRLGVFFFFFFFNLFFLIFFFSFFCFMKRVVSPYISLSRAHEGRSFHTCLPHGWAQEGSKTLVWLKEWKDSFLFSGQHV